MICIVDIRPTAPKPPRRNDPPSREAAAWGDLIGRWIVLVAMAAGAAYFLVTKVLP